MNPITLFLLSLETKVHKAEKAGDKHGKGSDTHSSTSGKSHVLQWRYEPERLNPVLLSQKERMEEPDTETAYKRLRKELKPLEDRAPARPGPGDLLKAAIGNVKNVANNTFDNTVGYVIAQAQNYRTKRHYKNNPESKDTEVVLIPGLFQNKGSQWRLARDLREAGHQPYHLKNNNGKPKKERERLAFKQLDDLIAYTGAKNHDRIISGHSDGASLAVGMATYKDVGSKYRIRAVQARAPSTHGIHGKYTPGQALLIPFAANDNVKKSLYAREGAVEHARKKPRVPVHIVAGEYDGLVTPKDAVYKHAAGYHLVRGPDSTHFGTSGSNAEMNAKFVRHIDDLVKNYNKKPTPHPRQYAARAA